MRGDDDHHIDQDHGMDEIEQKYRVLVERVGRHPMSEAARARVIGEIEAQYRRERVTQRRRRPGQRIKELAQFDF